MSLTIEIESQQWYYFSFIGLFYPIAAHAYILLDMEMFDTICLHRDGFMLTWTERLL